MKDLQVWTEKESVEAAPGSQLLFPNGVGFFRCGVARANRAGSNQLGLCAGGNHATSMIQKKRSRTARTSSVSLSGSSTLVITTLVSGDRFPFSANHFLIAQHSYTCAGAPFRLRSQLSSVLFSPTTGGLRNAGSGLNFLGPQRVRTRETCRQVQQGHGQGRSCLVLDRVVK